MRFGMVMPHFGGFASTTNITTMARTAEDVALMLQAVCGPDPRAPMCQPTQGRDFIAAVEAVVCSGNPPQPIGVMPGDRRDPELRRFGSPLHRIAGLSEAINEGKRRAAELAGFVGPVLISGEPGTGKSLFARVIHDLSKHKAGPFVTVDWDHANPAEGEARLLGRADENGAAGAFIQGVE